MKYLLLSLVCLIIVPFTASAAVYDITFPVDGENHFIDDFLSTRGSNIHHATDIMADRMVPVLAAQGGTVTYAPIPEPSWGWMIRIQGDDGITYNYIHLNNDTPGTDDGMGGVENAYAPGVRQGSRVERGQLIGWVGDSGNAEWVAPHLHFEMYLGDTPINPYESLIAAKGQPAPDPDPEPEPEPDVLGDIDLDLDYDISSEQNEARTISEDKNLVTATGETFCEADTLIRTQELPAVYYCGRDGNRYVFQNESTFFSWYDDFDDVEFISAEDMGQIPLKGSVTYKPGSFMVKLMSIPKVYAVAQGGVLRWVQTEEMATALYGSDWIYDVRDLPDSFFPAYTVGSEINAR